MSHPRIAKLEGLLQRIKTNAAKPRTVAAPIAAGPIAAERAAPEPASPAPVGFEEVDDPYDDYDPDVPHRAEMATLTEDDVLDAGDIVDVTDIDEEPLEVATDDDVSVVTASDSGDVEIDVDFDEAGEDTDVEQPPASSRRPKPAQSMDEALAAVAERERDVPLKTPPPESGRELIASELDRTREISQLPPPPAVDVEIADGADDIDDLLATEVDVTPSSERRRHLMPTIEQVGNTVDLPPSVPGSNLELDTPAEPTQPEAAQASASSEFEMDIPQKSFAGGYSTQLTPPPGAKEELQAHREREAARSSPELDVSEVTDTVRLEGHRSGLTQKMPPVAEKPAQPDAVTRPPVQSSGVAAVVHEHADFKAETFIQLLDASLSLGK